ncbi:MAG TPA: hormogonium polysaccharide biosynthesis protein HpsA [Nostocaceae cyanobacterium]|nr:hormogonium polysaccharide biosynthesis protein HpsA [Nostocaceae cyanobacterium]
MTKQKYTKASTRLLRQVIRLLKTLKTSATRWFTHFLRSNFRQRTQGGFVLPTTVLLILVVILVVTTLVFRTFSRTNQAIVERQQQVIYNAATPAIDRAKAKLEFLFRQETRLPAGVASDTTIQSILRSPVSGADQYTLPDETRLDNFTDSSGNPGIGWYFQQNNKTIAYSIIFKKRATNSGGTEVEVRDQDSEKAPEFVVRNGPVNTSQSTADKCGGVVQLAANESDWEPITSAILAKTFQVDAFVVENPQSPSRSVATLELQQDRQVDKGNKWGAYFRGDLELFQGPTFRWNGAMHSDSNLFFGPYGAFRSYLISAPSSCVNTSANDSKITVSTYTDGSGTPTFEGQILAGRLNQLQFGGSSTFDLYNGNGAAPTTEVAFGTDSDSINNTPTSPYQLAADPVVLLTEDKFQSTDPADRTNTTFRDGSWKTKEVYTKKRIFNEETNPPYLDDTYRADNRYGPNPTYDGRPLDRSLVRVPASNQVGDLIPSSDPNFDALTRDNPPAENPENLGLDGYWERRAVTGGLRVIVGQRLELGQPLGAPGPIIVNGVTSNLPTGRVDEFLQRRTQRDNLAAVQATAVYHYKSNGGTIPVACVATTAHPGTAETLRRGATFETINYGSFTGLTDPLLVDFFTGRGTNGWEFSVPADSTALETARANLALFAGDPDGAFPPAQEAAGSAIVHPYPELIRYGNFSELRRSDASASPSIADRAYIDTANCMLGMLAYNIDYLNKYDYAQNWGTGANQLLDDLNGELTSITSSRPEEAIQALDNRWNAETDAANKTRLDQVRKLARLVATKEQVRRDRANGVGYTCNFNTTVTTAPTYINDDTGIDKDDLNQLCSVDPQPKYEALHYLFPTVDHAEIGGRASDTYITSAGVNGTGNIYTAITDADIETISSTPNRGTWTIPRSDVTANIGSVPGQPNSLPNSNFANPNTGVYLNNLVREVNAAGTDTYYQVPFKDAALFNGREMMSVRVLNIDLNLLRTNNAPGGDTWLPINDNTATNPSAPPPNGVFYAFREDAVREDGIARPVGTRMNADPNSDLSDPARTALGISTKPVDFFPDPDRRPNGFRLKNGIRLDRGNNTAGMSFISNNAVYIQGDFNIHSTNGTTSNLIEEFTEKLQLPDWDNFYTRSTKDTRFAKPDQDTWRPTEILGDSVNVLSNVFCDGSIEDGIIDPGANPPDLILSNRYGCDTAARYTSYLNQNRPTLALNSTNTNIPLADRGNPGTWMRENPFDPNSPIQIDVNGKPRYCTAGTLPCPPGQDRTYELRPTGDTPPQTYLQFADADPFCNIGSNRKCVATASNTRVNAIIVQGLIPSRGGQSNGGFHMFPRMIENWSGRDLNMSGAFIQLRFSNQNVGPFDQDAWEPGTTPRVTDNPHEYNWYFLPPNRRWGYDVALQFQTGGPVSRRFATPGTTRSEVYREIAADDEYIKRLRCATKSDGEVIDPAATCT